MYKIYRKILHSDEESAMDIRMCTAGVHTGYWTVHMVISSAMCTLYTLKDCSTHPVCNLICTWIEYLSKLIVQQYSQNKAERLKIAFIF